MTKYKTSQQTKPLLFPLGFTKTFQTSELSPNYFSFCLEIHSKMPPKRKQQIIPQTRNTLLLFQQAALLGHCHISAAATDLAHNYAALALDQRNGPALCFTIHQSQKLSPLLRPLGLSFLLA